MKINRSALIVALAGASLAAGFLPGIASARVFAASPSESRALLRPLSVAPTPHAQSSSSALYDTVQPAVFPSGIQSVSPYDYFTSISCSSPGNCTAAGSFLSPDGTNKPMTQTSTNGIWAPVVATDVSAITSWRGSNYNGSFSSISCTSPGNCTAAGTYDGRAITQTSTNGVWAPAVGARFSPDTLLSGDGPRDLFYAVSCSGAGFCTAVGSFSNVDGYSVPMTETSTNGVWGEVEIVSLPNDLDRPADVQYTSVSCISAGNCTAAGSSFSYRDAVGNTFTGSSTNGVWGEIAVINGFTLHSLSCTATGDCAAAGFVLDANGNEVAATVSSSLGVWQSPQMVTFESSLQQPDHPGSELLSISCSSSVNCTAVGYYTDANWNWQPLMTTSTNGTWVTVVLPSYESALGGDVTTAALGSVSCSAAGMCGAAGALADVHGNRMAFTLTQADGQWASGVAATFDMAVSRTLRDDGFNAISCSGPSSCTAVGTYTDVNGNYPAMTQSFHAPTPSAPVNVSAIPAPGHVIVTWEAPLETYGSAVTSYRVVVLRASSRAIVSNVSVPGNVHQVVPALPAGSYIISLAAATVNGTGAVASTSPVGVLSSKGVRVPPAPRVMTSKAASGQVTLSWLPPVLSDGGSAIYQYVVSDGNGHGCSTGGDARFAATSYGCVINGLTNGRFYGFFVTAVNIMGASTPSATKIVCPGSAPLDAPIVTIESVTAHRATLNVSAPSSMGGRTLMYYQVSFDNGRSWKSLFYFTVDGQISLGSLKPNTRYQVLINARNQIGASPACALTFRTAKR